MKEESTRKSKGNYCFPNILAEGMKNVTQRIQYESSLLSILFILIGLIVLGIYTVFFTEYSLFMKIMIGLNTIAGFVFLSSSLITTYQQYINYLEVMNLLELPEQDESIDNQNIIEKEVKE